MRSLPERLIPLTRKNSLLGTLDSMTLSTETLKITQTVIIPWDDMIYLCGLVATLDAPMTVTG